MKRIFAASAVFLVSFVTVSGDIGQKMEVGPVLMKNGNFIVKSGATSIIVDPGSGGTIDSLFHSGVELLTGREVHPVFYGSTFWPSPQSIWNWPPPPVINGDPYSHTVDGDTLRLVSGNDPVTGLKVTKEIFPGKKDQLRIRYMMTNVSGSEESVAPWEITRVRKGGLLFFPVGNNPLGRKSFSAVPIEVLDGVAWYRDSKERPEENELTTADGTEGWAAYAIDGKLFVKKFPNIRPDECAPGEGEIAVYVSAVADYLEFEVQGKYSKLEPALTSVWEVTWIVVDLPPGTRTEKGDDKLVSFARKVAESGD